MFFKYKNNNFFFYHIPKTAGSTVKYILANNELDYNLYYKNLSIYGMIFKLSKKKFQFHQDIDQLKRIFNTDFYNDAIKFSVVRNHFDRLVSLYKWLKSGSIYNKTIEVKNISEITKNYMRQIDRDEFILNKLGNPNRLAGVSFNYFIKNLKHYLHPGELRPYVNEDTKTFNFFIRYENLEEDLNNHLKKFGLEIGNINIKINKSQRENYQKYFNNETRCIVEDLYKKDLEYFKYAF